MTEFDVFLSHNSKDKPAVRALALRLEERGIRVWLDEDQLIPGRKWQPLLEEGIERSATGAVLVGKDGLGPWEDEEMQALLRQAVRSRMAVIPVLLPDAPLMPKLPLLLTNRTWVDLRPGLTDKGLDLLEWGITGERPDSGRTGPQATRGTAAAPELEEPADEYGTEVDAPLAKLLDHADQLAPIRRLLADAAGDREIALVEACSEDWPSYLADHIHLQPWPERPADLPEAVPLRLTRFDGEAFWQALIDELPRARHAAEEADKRTAVRDWINGARLRVLYVPVVLERHGRHLPEIIRGAHATLAGLGDFALGTRVLVLVACVRAHARPPYWWPFYARLKLAGLDCCRPVDAMRLLDKPDVENWYAGFPGPLRTRYDRDRLKAELLDLFAPDSRGIRFDTVGRFHAAQTRTRDDEADDEEDHADPGRFIAFEALGRAILLAKPERAVRDLGVPDYAVGHPGEQRRSVVLIDEIDKAPRDVPNDILVEIENMQFDIPELSGAGRPTVRVALDEAENRYRPIVVFTSNSEKALPDPFLRRCVFHHLPFPPFDADVRGQVGEDRVTVESIVNARLGARYQGKDETSRRIAEALGFFRYLRAEASSLERRPTLAELLDWLDYLMPQRTPVTEWGALAALQQPGAPGADAAKLHAGIESLLLKKPDDQARIDQLLTGWRKARQSGER